ncbi:MAG TPA: serine hydrolase, partial [Polyangiales bacterium]
APVVELDPSGIRFVVEAALRRGELPGCVIAVGDARGVRYLEAFGERTTGEPMTLDTRFDLASLTKPVATALSIALLAERSVIDLRGPASHHLSELRLPDKRAITIEQLMLHTSGLPKVNPLSASEGGRARARAAIARESLLTPPGAHFEYSDLGYILLGEVVESVTGQSLDAFAREQLFAPLGMRTTHFVPAPGDSQLYAPTELRDDVLIRGVVDDPRAFRLHGVAGHAGLFSTASDLVRFARMLLNKGELDGVRVLSAASVERLLAPRRLDGAVRSVGFDVQSTYSLARPLNMSVRAVGHGGYTGTSIWIDPERDAFVILLSNRVHKGPQGTIHPLASAVGDLAMRALRRAEQPGLRLGVDVLEEERFARVRGRTLAVLSHLPARDAGGKSSLGALVEAPQVAVKAAFSPEHGLSAQSEGAVQHGSLRKLPVYSLFGATRRPSPQMLSGVETVVIDLVDVGTRFYTYMATALAVCEAAGELGIDVMLLDRPNPLDGVHVEGPLSQADYASFVNYHPLPLRHGMTAGELLGLLIRARGLGTRLHVVKLEGWRPSQWYGETGLTWHAPSPNLRSAEQALLYPAVGLVEGTNVSVGRGTNHAFEVLGAPFVDGDALARALEQQALRGVRVAATRVRPRGGPYT